MKRLLDLETDEEKAEAVRQRAEEERKLWLGDAALVAECGEYTTVRVHCKTCNGKGSRQVVSLRTLQKTDKTCPDCSGSGKRPFVFSGRLPQLTEVVDPCSMCLGCRIGGVSGDSALHVCDMCNGTGNATPESRPIGIRYVVHRKDGTGVSYPETMRNQATTMLQIELSPNPCAEVPLDNGSAPQLGFDDRLYAIEMVVHADTNRTMWRVEGSETWFASREEAVRHRYRMMQFWGRN